MINDLHNTTCDIYSYAVISKDTYGGVERVLVLRVSGIKCYETELTEEEVYRYGRQQVIADHLIFCAPISICATDKIYCYGSDSWYDVNYIDDCNDMEHHYEILCRTIRAPEVYEYSSSSSSSESSSSSGDSESSSSSSSP